MKALYFENKLAKVMALKVALSLRGKRGNRVGAALGRFSPTRYADVPEPRVPNARWLKVRNRVCGLCGTDIHFIFMDMDPKTFSAAIPGIGRKFLGHELVGEVVEIGAEVEGFRAGDRVAMRIDWPSCFQMELVPPCAQCAAGNYMLCENLGTKSLPVEDTGGGFSPFMVMHRTQPYKVPDALSDDRAVLLEPLASAVHGVLKSKPRPGDKVLVVGGGAIGLLSVAAARLLAPEAEVHCLVRYPFQAEVVKKLGAGVIVEGPRLYERIGEVAGARYVKGRFGNEILLGGFDVVYDTIGNARTVNDGLRWAKAGGTVVLVGIHFHPGKIDYSPVWCQEVALMGINCHATESGGRSSFDIAAELLGSQRICADDFITHRYPMAQHKEAIEVFLNKRESGAIKIVLEIQ